MDKTYRDLVAEAKASIREIDPATAWRLAQNGAMLVDVREPTEYPTGVAPGAVRIPRGIIESELPQKVTDPSTEIMLICEAGNRSALAAKTLEHMGYAMVSSVAGGMVAWKQANLPLDGSTGLTVEQRTRYARHLTLPQVGEDGQRRLLASRVALVGAGGLGSPAAYYLAAAGVGTLIVIDDDRVDPSNLQRQVLHATDRIGMPKADSAARTLAALNPDVSVEVHRDRLTSTNAAELFAGADVVVDGADNFPTRYLVNDASLVTRTPVVHGSVLRFEGQAAVFAPYGGACYRCLFPEPPPPELTPNCAEAGVLGVVPGVIGTIQAVETLKLLLGIGEPLVGQLLTYDALEQSFATFRFGRNPDCLACGDESQPPQLVDYDTNCRPVRSRSG